MITELKQEFERVSAFFNAEFTCKHFHEYEDFAQNFDFLRPSINQTPITQYTSQLDNGVTRYASRFDLYFLTKFVKSDNEPDEKDILIDQMIDLSEQFQSMLDKNTNLIFSSPNWRWSAKIERQFTANMLCGVRVTIDFDTACNRLAVTDFTPSLPVTIRNTDGSYSITVQSKDSPFTLPDVEVVIDGVSLFYPYGTIILNPTVPAFTLAPEAADIQATSFDIIAQANVLGTVYALILPDGSPTPTTAEIKAGQSQEEAGAGVLFEFTGLTESTDYDVYVLASDAFGNDTQVVLVNVSTISSIKPNLLLLAWTQSNGGTNPENGRVPYADMPTYLRTPPTNLFQIKSIASVLTLSQFTADSDKQWGWLNQMMHLLSPQFDEVILSKVGVGGTTILSGFGGSYNRSDFLNYATFAIAQANARWGLDNYEIRYLGDLGETNCLTEVNADDILPAFLEWFNQYRTTLGVDATTIFKKEGLYQDEDFPFIVPNGWAAQEAVEAADPTKNILIETAVLAELQDQVDDFSHYNARGAISVGNGFFEALRSNIGFTKLDSVKPIIASATISDAARNVISLVFTKELNPIHAGFWKDYTLSKGVVLSSSISANTLNLTCSENFYLNEVVILSYTKKQYYEGTVQDLSGNEIDNFVNQAIDNQSTLVQPTYSRIYTMDMSIDVNGWIGFSGGVVSRAVNIFGKPFVLALGNTDATPFWYRDNCFLNVIGYKYRVKISIYVPATYGNISQDYSFTLQHDFSASYTISLYPYIRKNVLGGQWFEFETTLTTATTSTRLVLQANDVPIGQELYVTDVIVDRII